MVLSKRGKFHARIKTCNSNQAHSFCFVLGAANNFHILTHILSALLPRKAVVVELSHGMRAPPWFIQ